MVYSLLLQMDQVTYKAGLSEQSLSKAPSPTEPWKNSSETVKPCWNKLTQGICKLNTTLDVYEVYH